MMRVATNTPIDLALETHRWNPVYGEMKEV